MESTITPEEIEKMKAFLKEHPVDPQYDGLLDGDIPTEQAHALIYESLLKQLGELPELTTLHKTTMRTAPWLFYAYLWLHEAGAGNFYTLLPGCGRAYRAAQTVTATTLKRLSDTLHRR